MGPRAVRITAEDFMIPAEFGGFRLAEHSAGQIGGVHLTLVEQQGRTIFGATVPAGSPSRLAAVPFPWRACLTRLLTQPDGRPARRRWAPGGDRCADLARAPW